MTWIKINDSFPDHPKVVGLTDSAFRTHLHGLCYCGRFLTDGFIPISAIKTIGTNKSIAELVDAGLWLESPPSGGFFIHDYLEHQTSKKQVKDKQEALRERQKRYRARKSDDNFVSNNETEPDDDWDNAVSNALVTRPEYRIQNTEDRIQNTDIKDNYFPRNKTAQQAVTNISNKLANARAQGINAWNLSKLVEDEWDVLHNTNDIGGCIALTAWYVSELQTRALTSSEIGRIGQMTKRFGRIALLAIDEAASKDLTDLVSYAYRVAQNLYKEKAGK